MESRRVYFERKWEKGKGISSNRRPAAPSPAIIQIALRKHAHTVLHAPSLSHVFALCTARTLSHCNFTLLVHAVL